MGKGGREEKICCDLFVIIFIIKCDRGGNLWKRTEELVQGGGGVGNLDTAEAAVPSPGAGGEKTECLLCRGCGVSRLRLDRNISSRAPLSRRLTP